MKNLLTAIVVFVLMYQFSTAQTLIIKDEAGAVKAAYQINTLDSVVFFNEKCVLDDEFNSDPFANGWKYTSNSNPEAKLAWGNGTIWVKDSIYGSDMEATGVEIYKNLDETVTGLIITAKANINTTPYPNTSPLVTFSFADINGNIIYSVKVSSDSCWCYFKGILRRTYFIRDKPDPVISMSWDGINQNFDHYVYCKINGTEIWSDYLYHTGLIDNPISKVIISIKSDDQKNTNKARVDFVKVCRNP